MKNYKIEVSMSFVLILSMMILAIFCVGCGSDGGSGNSGDEDLIADGDPDNASDGDIELEGEVEEKELSEDGDLDEELADAIEEELEIEAETKEDDIVEAEEVVADGDDDGFVKPCDDWDGLEDLPDANLIDNDCDGIDGSAENAIFVDQINGLYMAVGSKEYPVNSVKKALELASQSNPPKDIYLAVGIYEDPIVLEDGVGVYGGFNPADDWSRYAGNPEDNLEENTTRLNIMSEDESGNIRAIVASELGTPLAVAFLSIVSGTNHNDNGGSSYGVFVSKSAAVKVHNCDIRVGDGADGSNGIEGTQGVNGAQGGKGDNAKEDKLLGTSDATKGGDAAVAICDDPYTAGGKGGHGGLISTLSGDIDSEDGYAAPGAGDFGQGLNFGDGGSPHLGGNPGNNAAAGLGGDGNGLPDDSGLWYGSIGQAGAGNGGNGIGGGGGGGGGGSDAGICTSWWGGAGGGGGSGACGGTLGTGGNGGGGSFGIYYYQSTPLVYNTTVIVGNGGKGGNGALGGSGGVGGAGGDPGSGKDITCGFNDDHHAYAGGKGGKGGDGGKGGNGGGGGGGVSYAIYSYNVPSGFEAEIENVDLTSGAGGPGGTSPQEGEQYQGNQGESGDMVDVLAPVVDEPEEVDGEE